MRLLFVKTRLAWPRSSGHDVHCFHMMQALAQLGHEVSLATVTRTAPDAMAGLSLSRYYCLDDVAAEGECAPRGRAPLTKYQERFRSYYGVASRHTAAVARITEATQIDAVVAGGLDALPYLAQARCSQRVWYAADEWVWHHLSQFRLRDTRSWPNLEEALVKGVYERAYAPALDRVWVVSEGERRAMRWFAGARHVDVLPNGVDSDYFHPSAAPELPRSAIFWGRLDFGPNIQALSWFCQRVWPLIRHRAPHARFTIVGFQPSREVSRLAGRDGIVLLPDLPDLRSEVRRHQLVVLPFVSGGGIKNKMLEAASLGKAIVCTPRACGGLRETAPWVVLKPRPDEWASAILALWDDRDRIRKIGREARQWVTEHHTWSAAARQAVGGLEASHQERLYA